MKGKKNILIKGDILPFTDYPLIHYLIHIVGNFLHWFTALVSTSQVHSSVQDLGQSDSHE